MPGAGVNYRQEGQKDQQLTLSIISTTTNKFIFTDQRGQRRLEPKEPELVDLFAADMVTLLQQGRGFEDALQSLVIGQRAALNDS